MQPAIRVSASPTNATTGVIQDVVESPAASYNVVEEAGRVAQVAAEGAAAAGVGAYGGAIAEGVGTIAAALSSFFDLPFIVVFVVILVVLRLTENIIVHIAGSVPMAGHWLGPWTRTAFKFLDHIENAIIDFVRHSLSNLLHQMGQLTRIVLELEGIDLSNNTRGNPRATQGTVTQKQVQHLQSEIHRMQQQIGELMYVVAPVAPIPTTHTTPAVPAPVPVPVYITTTVKVPQNLWDQIHHLQGQVANIHRDLTAFNTRLDRIAHEAHTTAQQQVALSHEIHQVRAVAAGWQDVQEELENLGNRVNHFVSQTTADINHLHTIQAQLAPLGLLVQPGIKGLKVLRQLEDTPCMCPKLPNIPRLQPELLAMYEFLSHG